MKQGLLLCCLLVCALGRPVAVDAQTQKDAPSAVKAMEEGFRLFLDKKYQEAMEQYRIALIINPSYKIVWERMGLVEMERKNYPAARSNFIRLAALEPANPEVIGRIAETFEFNDKGQRFGKGFDAAASLSNYRRAVEVGQENARDVFLRGRQEFEKGEFRKARTHLRDAVRMSRDYAEAYWYLALSCENLKEDEWAYLYYRFAEVLGREKSWHAECRKKVRQFRRAL